MKKVERSSQILIHEILEAIKQHADTKNLESMEKFAVPSKKALGVTVPEVRKIARPYKKLENTHELAQELWQTDIYEARLVACFIENPKLITQPQIENWVNDFDSWAICDQACKLFSATPFAYEKVNEWAKSEKEFVKRACFSLMAMLAVHDKKANNKVFIEFLDIIYKNSNDNRNMVKKAVNWALRQIGKRNLVLNKYAIETAQEVNKLENKAAKWISSDALRELKNASVISRVNKKNSKI